MSVNPEVFWVGLPGPGYFNKTNYVDYQNTLTNTNLTTWKIANLSELKDAQSKKLIYQDTNESTLPKVSANWCLAGITSSGNFYYSMYPISEVQQWCSEQGVIDFNRFNGSNIPIPLGANIGGANLYGIKPNPDYPILSAQPGMRNLRWKDSSKQSALFEINGITFETAAFNTVRKVYNDPEVTYFAMKAGLLTDYNKNQSDYITKADCLASEVAWKNKLPEECVAMQYIKKTDIPACPAPPACPEPPACPAPIICPPEKAYPIATEIIKSTGFTTLEYILLIAIVIIFIIVVILAVKLSSRKKQEQNQED